MILFNKTMKMEFAVLAATTLLAGLLPLGNTVLNAVLLYVLFKNAYVLNSPYATNPCEAERAQMFIAASHFLFVAIMSILGTIPGVVILYLLMSLVIMAGYIGLAMDLPSTQQKLISWINAKEHKSGKTDHTTQQKLTTSLFAAARRVVSSFGRGILAIVFTLLGLFIAVEGKVELLLVKDVSQLFTPGPAMIGLFMAAIAVATLLVNLVILVISQFQIMERLRLVPHVLKFNEVSSTSRAAQEVYRAALYPFCVLMVFGIVFGAVFMLSSVVGSLLLFIVGASKMVFYSMLVVSTILLIGIPAYGYSKMRDRILSAEDVLKNLGNK